MKIIWYHTNEKLSYLFKSLKISPKSLPGIRRSKSCVWLTGNPERTKLPLSFSHGSKLRIGIEYNDKLLSWDKYKLISRISYTVKGLFERQYSIYELGKPEWYFSLDSIHSSTWLIVDILENNQWRRILGGHFQHVYPSSGIFS